jgi:hypothetical protein
VNDKARRKELVAQYKRTHPEAGVYRIVNARNNKALLGSALNLASVRNKLDFARSTNSPGALDWHLRRDIRQFGMDAFSLEVLNVLETGPEMTPADTQKDLAVLEEIWRDQIDASLQY